MVRRPLLCIVLSLPVCAFAQSWGINTYGLSHHFNRTRAHELHVDNEVNPGLGVRYRVPHSEHNRGKTTIAPLPLAAFETRSVTLNAVYIPRVSEINEVAALGFWATWWIR